MQTDLILVNETDKILITDAAAADDDDLERMWKLAVVTYFKCDYIKLHKTSVRLTCLRTTILIFATRIQIRTLGTEKCYTEC